MKTLSLRQHNPRPAIHPADRVLLTKLLQPFLHPLQARLVLFGSRARGDADIRSDLDLAIKAPLPLPGDRMAAMREALEQSNIPYRVDLLDYATAPAALRAAIDDEGVEWTA